MLKVLLTIGALQVVSMLVLLVRTKTLALLLGPEAFGVMAVMDKLLAVASQTASLSMPFAAIRFLPSLWSTDRRAFARHFRAMWVTVVALSLAAAAYGVVATMRSPGRWGAELTRWNGVILVGFLTVPVLSLVPLIQNAIAGRLDHRGSMYFQLAHSVVFTASAVLGARAAGLWGLYSAYAVMGLALVAVAVFLLERSHGGSHVSSWRDLVLPARFWRFSAALFSLAVLSPYASLYVHYRVLRDLGASSAGWMQAAVGISLAVRSVLGSAHPVFLTPHVNRGTSDRMEWATAFQRTFCLLTAVVLPPLLLAPGLAIRLLYSREFSPGARFVFLFVLVEVVTLLAGTYQAIVIALDRLAYHVAQNLVAQAVIIGLAAWLIPRAGIGGAALATLVAQVLLYLSTSVFLRSKFGLRPDWNTLGLTLYLMVALAITGLVGRAPLELAPAPLMARFALYAALIAVLLLFLRPDERDRIGKLRAELARRLT